MRFDLKNKLLLEHLLAYSRYSIKDLAKALNTSKAAIIRRINFLEKEGYISRYDAIVNWQKMPFFKRVYFVALDKNHKQFEKSVIAHSDSFAIMRLSGYYTHQIWCFSKTKTQMKEFESLLKEYPHKTLAIKHLEMPRVPYFNLALKLPLPKMKDEKLQLDSTDIKIMKHMAYGHARDSFMQMSKDLNIPYDTLHYHATRLIKSGYFNALLAQPGEEFQYLQNTNLVITCKNQKIAEQLYDKLSRVLRINCKALANGAKVLVLFLSLNIEEYRTKLNEILSLVPKKEIEDVIIAPWTDIIMNNRYPLEYFNK